MKKLVCIAICLIAISLQSCRDVELADETDTKEIFAVDKDKVERPGSQSGG